MIDVFLLVEEGLLRIDPDDNSINCVQFCECDEDQFVEIREMIAKEDAGFFGDLEASSFSRTMTSQGHFRHWRVSA
jgi:hypothetical protein